MVFKVFNDYNTALVGVQEALHFQLEEISANAPQYSWIGVGRDGEKRFPKTYLFVFQFRSFLKKTTDGVEAGEYAAIFYQPALLEVLEQGTFWFCSTPDVPGCYSYGNTIPRIATWGRFRHRASGETFYHYNAHYDHISTNSREKSSEQLVCASIFNKQTQ